MIAAKNRPSKFRFILFSEVFTTDWWFIYFFWNLFIVQNSVYTHLGKGKVETMRNYGNVLGWNFVANNKRYLHIKVRTNENDVLTNTIVPVHQYAWSCRCAMHKQNAMYSCCYAKMALNMKTFFIISHWLKGIYVRKK